MYQIELELGGKSGIIDRSSDVVVPNVSMRKPIAAGNMERAFSAFLKTTKVFPFSYVAEIFRARTCMHVWHVFRVHLVRYLDNNTGGQR